MANDYVVAWDEILEYLKDARELAIGEMAGAVSDRQLWAGQGKLALVEELLTLKDIFATLTQQKVEAAQEAVKPASSLRDRVDKRLGVAEAIKLYGKARGSQAEGG